MNGGVLQVLDAETFGPSLIETARRCAPFVCGFWLRVKHTSGRKTFDLASALKAACPDTPIMLSDRADIALAAGLAGVHLGAGTIPPEAVRKIIPPLIPFTIGYSAHSLDEIKTVSADYYTLSPLFPTEKPYPVHPIGPMDVKGLSKQIFGLGGISAENIHELTGKGYAGVAGISFAKEIEAVKRAADRVF